MQDVTILTTRQLAQVLQTSIRSIQRMVAEGTLRAYKIRSRGGWRFLLTEALEDLGRSVADLPVWEARAPRVRELAHDELPRETREARALDAKDKNA